MTDKKSNKFAWKKTDLVFDKPVKKTAKKIQNRLKAKPAKPPHVVQAGDGFYVAWNSEGGREQLRGPFKTREEAERAVVALTR